MPINNPHRRAISETVELICPRTPRWQLRNPDNSNASWRTPSCTPASFRGENDQEKEEEDWKDEGEGVGETTDFEELKEIIARLEEGFDTDARSVCGKARHHYCIYIYML